MADAQANIGIGVDISEGLAAIRQLQREISAFHTSMAKGGALANAESMRLSQNLINTINASGQFSAGMTRISSSTESFTNALEKNKLSMSQYFKYAGGASRSFGKMFSREFNTVNRVAQERVKDLQTQYISMGRDANGALQAIKVRPLALDMNDLGTKVQMVAQKQQIFNQLLKQGSTNLLNFGKNTQWAGRQLMVGFTIPLTIFGATAAREFQKLEEQAVKFRRVYGDMFTTDAETEQALANIRELADEFTKYGIAVEKTVGLAAKVAQMGNVGSDLTAQVTQATRLAVLGGLEQEEALDTTISLTNAFGIAAEDLAGKIAFLNAAENQTILAIEDFNEAIPKAGSVVQQLGGDVEDLAFMLTAMREGGINASQAANAIKSSLGRMINPTAAATEKLRGFGIDIVGIVESNVGDLNSTVTQLGYALDGLDPLNRARAIETLFGKFQFARMSTMFSNIVKEGSQANRVLQLTTNSTEELAIIAERELKRVEESPAFKLQKEMEKLKAALAPIGAEFIKAVTPIVQFGTKILKAFNEMGDGGKQFIVILTAVAGVVAPAALMAFGLIANGVANLIKFFALLGRGFMSLSGSSKVLGTGTEYLTQQQIEASAVAASLGQSHNNLIQVFSAEANAVRNLAGAYRQALVAQSAFRGSAAAAGASVPKPRGYARGGLIKGPGTGTSDSIIAAVSNKEFIVNAEATKENLPFLEALNSGKIKVSDIPGFASGGSVGGQVGLDLARAMSGSDEITPKLQNLANSLDKLISRIDRTEGPGAGQAAVESQMDRLSGVKTEGGLKASSAYRDNLYKASMQHPEKLHIESGERRRAEELRGQAGGAAGQVIDDWATVNPDKEIQLKSSFTRTGSAYANRMLSAETSERGMPASEAKADYEKFGASKWDDAIVAGGGDVNDQSLMDSFNEYDQKMIQLQQEAIDNRVEFFVDSNEDIDKMIAKERQRAQNAGEVFDEVATRSKYESYENMDQKASAVLSPQAAAVRQQAIDTKKAARIPITNAERDHLDFLAQGGGTPEQQAAATRLQDKYKNNKDKLERDFSGGGQVFEDGVDDVQERQRGIESANPKDIYDVAAEKAGRNSPHPESFSDGADDAKEYMRGQDSVLNAQSDPYAGTNLAAPQAPQVGYMPDDTSLRGKLRMVKEDAIQKFNDSAPGQYLGKKVSKLSGTALTDSEGNITYDPNTDPDAWASQISDGAPMPVRVVDGFEIDPEFQETMERGTANTENLNEQIGTQIDAVEENTGTVQRTAEEQKEIDKTNRRQNRGALAGKMMMGLGGVTMAAGMATQVDGVVGETAQKIVGPLGALTGILPMLTALGPIFGSLVAVLGLVVAGFLSYRKAITDTARETYALQRAMGSSKEAIQSFAEFSGKVTQTELYQRQQENRFNPFNIAAGKSTFGENFAEDEAGQALVGNIKTSLVELGRDQTVTSVFLQLGQAVGEGALSAPEARSIATELGDQIGDMSFGMEVNANLMRLVGPGGEELLAGDRLTILADIREERERTRAEMDLSYDEVGYGDAFGSRDTDANERLRDAVTEAGGIAPAIFTSGKMWSAWWDAITGAGAGKENMEQMSTILAQGVNDADAFAADMAAIDASYAESLAKAYSMDDEYEIDRLEREKQEEQDKALARRAASQNQVITELQKDAGKARLAMKEAIKVDFADDEEGLKQMTDSLKAIQGLRLEDSKSLELEYMLTSGDMPFHTAMAIVENFEEMPEVSSKIIEVQTNFGDLSGDAAGLFNIFKSIDEDLAEEFVLNLDTTDLDTYQKQIEGFGAISRIQGLFPEGEEILLDVALKDPEVIDRILMNISKLEGVENDQITLDFIANTFGEETLAAASAIWNDIATEDRKEALYSILTALDLDLGEGYDDLFESLKGQTIAGVTINEPADILSLIGSRTATTASTNRSLNQTEDTGSGGGGEKESYDDILVGLRNVRQATIDMKRGWDGMNESIQKFLDTGTVGFNGLANQMRRLGVGEGLIERITGMDPDEYEKRKNELFVFDAAGNIIGTTQKLQNLGMAMNQLALGEYMNSQQQFIENTNNQFTAMQKLTAEGLSFVEAYEMVQDQALATAIAMGITREQTAELIRITEIMNEMREKYDRISEEEQAAKAVAQTNKQFNERVAVLNKLSSQQGKYTDEQISAILNDSNLTTLFLNPKIDSKTLSRALENARRAANLELQIKVATEEGKKGLFDELVAEIQDEFNRQEAKIDIDFRLATKDDQKIVNEAQNQIAAIQYQVDDYEAQLKGIEDQEEVINEKYDERYKALEQVAAANERINRIRAAELDVADALSRGDIAAAARAQQELRATEAQNRAEEQKEMLQRQQEAELARVRSESGMSRQELEDRIKSLQDEIFGIEEDSLEPAQERLRIAEYEKQLQVDALEVSGRTRDVWDQIANSTDIATQNTEEFAKNVERALALYEYFVNDVPLDTLGLFGEKLEDLREMGIDTDKETQRKTAAVVAEVAKQAPTTKAYEPINAGPGPMTDDEMLIKYDQVRRDIAENDRLKAAGDPAYNPDFHQGLLTARGYLGQSLAMRQAATGRNLLPSSSDSVIVDWTTGTAKIVKPSGSPAGETSAQANRAGSGSNSGSTPQNTVDNYRPSSSKSSTPSTPPAKVQSPSSSRPPTVVVSPGTSKSAVQATGAARVIVNNSQLSNKNFASVVAKDDRMAALGRGSNSGGVIKPMKFSVGGKVKGYSAGGYGFGTMGSDNIPAILTPGEFVIRKRAVQDFGMKNLEKINNGEYSGGSVYNYSLAVNVKSDADADKIAKTVMKEIKRVDAQRVRGNRI